MRNKHGLKAFVLTIMAALGMLAFSAVGAQAQLPGASTPGTFSVNGVAPTGDLIAGEQLGPGYLLVAARDLKIECKTGTVEAGSEITSATHAEATVVFEECVALSHKLGTPLKGCEFKELKTVKAAALALPILHGEEEFVLFEPLNLGPEFTNVKFKAGTPCTLPLNNPVTGSVVARVVNPEEPPELLLEDEVLGLEFSQAIQLLSGDVLKYGVFSNTAYVDADADVGVEGGGTLGVH